jgi:hypothetical protein
MKVENHLVVWASLTCGPLADYPSIPPHALIWRLEVHFSCDNYGGIMGDYQDLYEYYATRHDFDEQASRCKHCGLIKRLNGFELKINLKFGQEAAGRYEEVLVENVYWLKVKDVKLDGSYAGPNPSFDYDKPLSEWEEKIRTNRVFVSNLRCLRLRTQFLSLQ